MTGKFRIDIYEKDMWKGKAFVECRLLRDFDSDEMVVDSDQMEKLIKERFPMNSQNKDVSFDITRVK